MECCLLCPRRFRVEWWWNSFISRSGFVVICWLWHTEKKKKKTMMSFMRSFMSFLSSATEASWVVREVTDCWRDLFSSVSVVSCSWMNSKFSCSCWNSSWSISTRVILPSSPESLSSFEKKMSLTSAVICPGSVWMECDCWNFLLDAMEAKLSLSQSFFCEQSVETSISVVLNVLHNKCLCYLSCMVWEKGEEECVTILNLAKVFWDFDYSIPDYLSPSLLPTTFLLHKATKFLPY